MQDIKIPFISCVIIAKNAQASLKNTLDSLVAFDDVVLYNNGSTDQTEDIARSFPNVNLVQGEFLGFGPTKNKAASYAKNAWVLSLDADEVISHELLNSLQQTPLDEKTVYTIQRVNHYRSRPITHCWGNDVITRIYNKQVTAYNDNEVHESIITEGLKIQPLSGNIKHYPYRNISDFIVKLDHYSSLFAKEQVGKKSTTPLKAIVNAQFAFIKTYLLKRGFLDGYPGLVIAFSHMATTFYKHMKLYELNQRS